MIWIKHRIIPAAVAVIFLLPACASKYKKPNIEDFLATAWEDEELSKEGIPDEDSFKYIESEEPFFLEMGISETEDLQNILDEKPLQCLPPKERLKKEKEFKTTWDLACVQDEDMEIIEEDEVAEGFDIPIYINKDVKKWIKYFQTKGKRHFKKWLERSGKYIPMMRKILRENGLPEDLVYLAMIESGFHPHAYSRARASGPWQFIYSTGKLYGLRVDWWIDERRDPEKSTIAAAAHLKDLYDRFGSWYLAAAGYNAGALKIERAMKRYDTEDFWELARGRYLRRETKNYVPKLLAAALIAKNPEKYGFTNIKYQEPIKYEKVNISRPTDLSVIAKAAGVSVAKLRALNPELRRWFTPPNYPNYELKVPVGTAKRLLANLAKIKPSKRLAFLKHRIRRGETISHIARRYGISARELMRFNRIRNPRRIRAGKIIVVPVNENYRPPRHTRVALRSKSKIRSQAKRKGDRIIYEVKPGDTLWSISRAFDVTVTQIRRWNRLHSSRLIHPGTKLTIYTSRISPKDVLTASSDEKPYIRHRVRYGETLYSIARRYGVRIKDLKRWNRLKNARRLRTGTILKIYGLSTRKRQSQSAYKSLKYKVKRGDSLWSIARKFKVSIKKLAKFNNLKPNSTIYAGKILVVPQEG